MPSLPSHLRIIARSDAPGLSTTNTGIISVVIACVTATVVTVMLAKYTILPWWRGFKERKVAKVKAIKDRKAWYRSTRPVMRRPETPHILNLYTRSPHIQGHQEIGSPSIAPPLDLKHSDASSNRDVSGRIEVSHFTGALPVALEPFPRFDLDDQRGIESVSDAGLQLMYKHHTGSTMSTMVSVGVAVPMKLPTPMSPTEVYTGHLTAEELDSDEVFVVGDHEDV
jgi:hypothetical protein